jgi:hypothetical protein
MLQTLAVRLIRKGAGLRLQQLDDPILTHVIAGNPETLDPKCIPPETLDPKCIPRKPA